MSAARRVAAAVRSAADRRAWLALAAVLVLAAGAGLALAVAGGDSAVERGEEAAPASAEAGSEPRAAAAAGAGDSDAVGQLVAEMPVRQKVAQLMLVGLEGTGVGDPVLEQLEELGYAGVVLEARNYVSPGQVHELATEAAARSEAGGHPAPWIMAPQEGGEFNAFADVPPEKAPAEVATAREAADLARQAADALLDLEVNGILAPVLDVGPLGGGAIGERAYSDLAEKVTDYAGATVGAYREAGIFAAAKHFPGLGAASQPTEEGPANVGLTLDQLEERDLPPFRAAIAAGAPGIVVGHGLYGVEDFVTPASLSPAIVTDLLRDDLGFRGVAISDDITEPAITATLPVGEAAVESVRAGIDLVYVSQREDEQRAVYGALLGAARKGLLPPERIDEALTRNLEAKRRAGLLDELLEGAGGGREGGDRGGDGGERGDRGGDRGGDRSERGRGSGGQSPDDDPAALLREALDDADAPALVDPQADAAATAKGAASP